jgi:hypothetical protein
MFLPTFYTDREKGLAMRREWELEDLIECWTLDEDEFALVGNKTGATRLGFSLLLKFFETEGGSRGGRTCGDLTGDDRENVEVSALALHLIQATIAYLNAHLIQIILRDDPKLRARLTPEDLRGLSALFWSHLNLYGRLELDMTDHLDGLPTGQQGQGQEP